VLALWHWSGYIATIFAANWAIVTFGIVPVGFGLMAPAGVYFVGLAFTLRDAVQEYLGKRYTVLAVVAGASLSVLISPQFALASGAGVPAIRDGRFRGIHAIAG
jgi:uncharacterized PurR-regulated membrane protein YhhQ (DUF165 family)